LAHLPYKLSGRQPNKGIWQILLIRTQNLANLAHINSNMANLADMNSKLGESCRYELKNLANLADMNWETWRILPMWTEKLGEPCRYELKNLANLAGMNSKTWRTLPYVNSRMANLPIKNALSEFK
jgi:hypothetical protein